MTSPRALLAALFVALVAAAAPARADLRVFPTRILLEDKDRSAQITLRHEGLKTTRYRISLVHYQMNADGNLSPDPQPALANGYAGDLIRYSPRVTTLEPNVEQVVRIQLRKPADLREGEYVAHIRFETFDEDDAEPAGSAVGPDGLTMALKAHRAVAIPIVVRHGALTAQVALSGVALDAAAGDGAAVKVGLKKDGNRSVFGDMKVFDGAATEPVAEVKGISLYGQERSVTLPLAGKLAGWRGKTLRVEFKEQDVKGAHASIEQAVR